MNITLSIRKILFISMLCLYTCTFCIDASHAIALKEIDILNAMIGTLESKVPRTDIEENILLMAKIIKENSPYLDENTLKEFNDIAYTARIIEKRDGVMKNVVAKKIAKLAETQVSLYNDYLKATEYPRDKIAKLLEDSPSCR